ncbi:DUF3459 domain-containing protein [Polycladomyces sp. WAk]|uniref:Alpha-amylase n=1 Tax=Polycladomyces zharkentensis TaxID=2807616 RepID=A0ABS2WKI7_9BACL|nr:alpha-amylase family glycosyl hydrolase [Polycladomyces sp. WAk]MBN2909981.1 DUF3459 domain-containing protein [Polycladomyces sp. WAk]
MKGKRIISCLLVLVFLFVIMPGVRADNATASPQGNRFTLPQGVFYEIYVRSFTDANGDGDGDLAGITSKLDYLNDGRPDAGKDLEVDGLWLMPITKSPSYHKYDVVDYYQVDPQYGTLKDFRRLVGEAHKRGIKVIMDLVVNHTSNQHPWFVSASRDKNSPYRDYYIWADENTDIHEKGPWGQPVWHETYPGSGDYYYGLFWSGMPDLNYDNPRVREEIIKIGKFWLKQGADGFRLDAAKHIYPDEQEAKNHEWWSQFRREMQKVKSNVYLVGEVWDAKERVAPYYAELDSLFNFDLSGRILQSLQQGQDAGIAALAAETGRMYAEVNPRAIDAPFLTNHDQNRTMSVLNGDVNKAKTAAAILLTLPGNPFLYYGEEIGMLGEKPDEYIREPFRWYPGHGPGQTTWEEPRFNTGPNAVSVQSQMHDPHSLLHWYRQWIRLRHRYPALTYGDLKPLSTNDARVAAYQRVSDGERLTVLHNLSGQTVTVTVPADHHLRVVYAGPSNVQIRQNGADQARVTLPAYTSALLK